MSLTTYCDVEIFFKGSKDPLKISHIPLEDYEAISRDLKVLRHVSYFHEDLEVEIEIHVDNVNYWSREITTVE